MASCPKAALFPMCVVLTLTHDKTEVSLFTHNDLDPEDVPDLWTNSKNCLETGRANVVS